MEGTSEFGGWIIALIWSWGVFFAAPLCLQTKISSVRSQKADSQHWSMTEICQRHHRLCVLFMNHKQFDLENKLEFYIHTIQYFYLFLLVFIELQFVLFILSVQKHQKAFWLMSVRMDDRMDICNVSICFCLVILNKVKLKNGLKCLTPVGFEAERRHIWHSYDLCCYKSSYGWW